MNLLIIDKSKLITDRLLIWLKEADEIETINAVATFAEAIIAAEHMMPDIVLLDMNLPSLKSIDIIKSIKKINNETSFIVMFNQVNDIKKQYCEYLGVDFILDKYHDIEKIIPAINVLHNRKKTNYPSINNQTPVLRSA